MSLLLAAIVASVISFAFGALWYGPFFGKTWKALHKIKEKDTRPEAKPLIIGFLRQFVTAFIIAYILTGIDVRSGIITISLWWIAFTAMPSLSDVIWIKKPIKLYFINVLYELCSVIIMAVVIMAWFSTP